MRSSSRRSLEGWRAKIGLIRPTHQGKMAQLWFDTAPDGVEVMDTTIAYRDTKQEEFESGFGRAADVAQDLVDAGASIVVMAGTPPALLGGPELERGWRDELAQQLGVPVVSPMLPQVTALRAMSAENVIVASYYRPQLNSKLRDYLAHFGMVAQLRDDAAMLSADEEESAGLQQLGHSQVQGVAYTTVYAYCKHLVSAIDGRGDTIYINGSGWDVAPAAAYLEEDLELPVVFAQAAVIWYTYRTLRIRCHIDGLGTLLKTWPALPVMN